MSKQHYEGIMNKGLESRQKPSNPSKNINFVGRVRDLKVFIGNFTYECNFMILEDTTSIIDHHLGEVVFGKPFVRKTGLVYDPEEGMVTFEKDNKKITFKMPHKMEAFNFKDVNTNSIQPFVLENNDDRGKTYYSDSLTLGPEYREDESYVDIHPKATTLGEAIGDDIENPIGTEMGMPVKEAEKENEAENGIKNKPIRKARKEETTEAPSSQLVEYYLKHRINRKLIEVLVDNHRGPVYKAILRKKIISKEDIRGNFEIPCNIGGLKHMNALVEQGSDVNVILFSTYMKLTNERPVETDNRLSLASHSYIYPLEIAKDVLVVVAEYVYPINFMILDIKEDEKRTFILGTSFLTTAKAVIKFDKGTINLTFGKSKISFHRIPESICKGEKGIKNDIKPIAPTMIVNRLVLEWDKKIKLHQEKEMEFDRWRNKNFKNKRLALVKIEDEVDDEGEVTGKRVAKGIEEYEKSRANLDSAGSSGGNTGNAGGTVNVQGCSHKTFMNGKPHSFNGTEGVVGLRHWIDKVEQVFETCKCAEEDKVMFAASTFEGRALTWWNGNVHTLGLVNANHIPWTEFKTMMTTEYCLATEIQRMEQELWTLTLKGDGIEAYNNHFHELAMMCPELVPTEKKKIERYTRGFPERIKGNITSSKPATLHDAIYMARELVEQAVQGRATRIGESNKRKRQETARAYAAAPTKNRGYAGNLPKCNRCNFHHSGRCPPKCQKCQRTGHLEKDCRAILLGACNDFLQNVTYYGCAYVVVENPHPNVVTGTFLFNDHYACILFDSSAEKSFVSSAFTPFIDIAATALNTSYEVELADGKVVSTNTVFRGCTLVLLNHVFKIDLLPTRLGSFDVIIGMDWLSYHRAVIDCYEKIIRIPLPNGEILKVQGEGPEKDPGSLACIKADTRKLDDIRVVRDFPKVFPDDLSGLPPVREIEFCIDLIPSASLVVKSPYRLSPSEMLELSNQLKEL
ncbi:putative reverse transcriptase domain-containing protein [Tanacetum coccineum]|uniref:Reverse transcriptase domain-containing protein n=1 Tax=Tanacetum coccineum TaxID=301880 RepID=A0ABQ5I9K2_9ASTR